MANFQEYQLRCANCDSTKYSHRQGFHLWNHYYCPICKSNFHSPRPVSNRTKSSRYDSHREYNKHITYENLNKSRRRGLLLRLSLVTAVVVGSIILIAKVGIVALFGLFGAFLLWLIITHPPRRRKQRGKIKLF